MRPAINDSLISGQPEYFEYSNIRPFALPDFCSKSRDAQAIGSVRLQVTGNPPTTKGLAGESSDVLLQPRATAAVPSMKLRRFVSVIPAGSVTSGWSGTRNIYYAYQRGYW